VLVVDFLLQRCHEVLVDASCDFEIDKSGRLSCRCQDPAEGVSAALEEMALILWLAELDETGETFLRMLADAYADHPEYRPEWHELPTS